MTQCVPSWENNGTSATPRLSRRAQFNSNLFIPHVPSMLDDGHEVAAEQMWEKGELVLQDIAATGKTMPILIPSPENNFRYEFEKPRAGGTLESVVNQGTRPVPVPQKLMSKDPMTENLFPWFYGHGGGPAANLTAMDALVPCSAGQVPDSGQGHAGMFTPGHSAGVGSCSGKEDDRKGTKRRSHETREESSAARVPSSEWSEPFEWESGQISLDTSETERETGTWGFTSTSATCGSPENTSTDEYDSACQSRRPQVKRSRLEYSNKSNVKSSISTQRSMTAFSTTYNQSEQRRRDEMEERMVTLQKMVPNSSKVDKVAVLDEVIEHLKQLQSQVEMLNRTNMVAPPATLTMHQYQHLQLQMMLNMRMMMMMMTTTTMMSSAPTDFMGMMGIGMGGGVGLDPPNPFTRFSSSSSSSSSSVPTRNGPPPFINAVPSPVDFINMTTSPFLMHTDPISMFLAANYESQQQLTTMDGYGTMAAFFNQPQLPQLKRPCG